MASVIETLETILYPFGYFIVLGIILEIAKYATLFFVAGGRLRNYHAIENYWIYLLVTVFCVLIGVFVGIGNWGVFCRWFTCSQLAGLMGIHIGYDKAHAITDEELKDLQDGVE